MLYRLFEGEIPIIDNSYYWNYKDEYNWMINSFFRETEKWDNDITDKSEKQKYRQ